MSARDRLLLYVGTFAAFIVSKRREETYRTKGEIVRDERQERVRTVRIDQRLGSSTTLSLDVGPAEIRLYDPAGNRGRSYDRLRGETFAA